MSARLLRWFFILQAAVCIAVFRDALWGGSLLAPLDILPAVFPKYRQLDPQGTGLPRNHHVIDQIIYDVPLQRLVHAAWRSGEAPWWDPFTHSGRPLLADAHISATDPIRVLLCLCLPFELAYNWTLVLHFVLCGLGMCWWLSRLKASVPACLLLSLAYEFSGGYAAFIGHPWVQASFLYYPFLWMTWDRWREGRPWALGVAGLLLGGVFCAGNLQSHPYVALFGGAYVWGRAGGRGRLWLRLGSAVAVSALIGALIAAPVLGAQLEAFQQSARTLGAEFDPRNLLAALASASVFYPWSFGTFRTLDLSKFTGQNWHLGFILFIGCAAAVLAVVGAAGPARGEDRTCARRAGLALIAAYLLVISTPLNHFLYMRCAPLALIGLTLLAGLGLERLASGAAPWTRAGWLTLGLAAGIAVLTNAFAVAVFPRIQSDIQRFVENKTVKHRSFVAADSLRAAQIRRLPAEISFRNPQALLGFLGLMTLGLMMLKPVWRNRPVACWLLLSLNLAPVLLYFSAFVPRHSLDLWEAVLAGGTEQQRVASKLRGTPERLWEDAPGLQEMVFPGAMAALYEVRVLQGYAAVYPPNLASLAPELRAAWLPRASDWIYRSASSGVEAGEFSKSPRPGLARFEWMTDSTRPISISRSSPQFMALRIDAGPAGRLLWTDTRYPGWTARVDGMPTPLRPEQPCFSSLEIPPRACEVRLRYVSATLPAGLGMCAVGLLCVGGLCLRKAGEERASRRALRAPGNAARWACGGPRQKPWS